MSTTQRTFMGCIPVRLGALIISIAVCALAVVEAVQTWKYYKGLVDPSKFLLGTTIAIGAAWCLLAAIALFGFVGATFAARKLISMFHTLLVLDLFVNIGLGIMQIYNIWKGGEEQVVKNCGETVAMIDEELAKLDSSSTGISADECKNFYQGYKYLLIVGFIILILLNIYLINIVRKYSLQLKDDKDKADIKAIKKSLLEDNANRSSRAPSRDMEKIGNTGTPLVPGKKSIFSGRN